MEETKHTLALVLKRQDYRESDSLVTVITKDFGKLNLVARGTKKLHSKLAGHLEPANLIDLLIIKGKNLDYVGSAVNSDAYLGVKDNLNKIYYVGQALAWFNRLVRSGEADQRLFFLLGRWLEVLDVYPVNDLSKERGELLWNFFALKLMTELGYQPEMHQCLDCHQKIAPGQNYFNLKNGGLVDIDCYEKGRISGAYLTSELLSISDNCVKLIRFIIKSDFNSVSKIKIDKKLVKELSRIVNGFLVFHV